MATALLIATCQRTAAWQPACQNHHQNGEAWRGEGRAARQMRVHMCAHVCWGVGGWGCRRRGARRMEKLARENKVNEAWRRLPSPVFGRSKSCLLIHCYHHSRGKDRKQQPQGGVVAGGEQSGWKRILCVYLVWLWLLTETTLDSRGLQSSPCVFEQKLTCTIHLHFP